ncbi:type II toxin-antitoxin system VapC family toxin [Microlunatus parietis]|uniref:Putative nucleic acid-binding protein n=1 Tax=Microlunatus parietis TaxID=682979 RepID=A0A7Y9LDG7_9ACTN|nr:PIN domain-containing protein [Microlunatus parietis]NYE72765.1 putative nucleic acid-binding protein [Microlunatus parietis]
MIIRPHSILLDAEALSALAAGTRTMQAWATAARRSDSILHASAVTLAEVTDGTARDADVRRISKALRIVPVSEEIGYTAGRLRAGAASTRRKPRDLAVDAIVAATALVLPPPVAVLTGDVSDLRHLLADTEVRIEGLR